METYYLNPLITVCIETSIQQKRLPTSVNNVVLIFSYGDRSHFIEKRGTFYQLCRQITQHL